jgi:hypothetical protein
MTSPLYYLWLTLRFVTIDVSTTARKVDVKLYVSEHPVRENFMH